MELYANNFINYPAICTKLPAATNKQINWLTAAQMLQRNYFVSLFLKEKKKIHFSLYKIFAENVAGKANIETSKKTAVFRNNDYL